jgi:hypothetical protein
MSLFPAFWGDVACRASAGEDYLEMAEIEGLRHKSRSLSDRCERPSLPVKRIRINDHFHPPVLRPAFLAADGSERMVVT